MRCFKGLRARDRLGTDKPLDGLPDRLDDVHDWFSVEVLRTNQNVDLSTG